MKTFIFNKNYKDLKQVEEFYNTFKVEYYKIRNKGDYPYNSLFEGKIEGIQGDDEKTAIYLLQRLMKLEEKENHRVKMLRDGFVELSKEIIIKAINENKKIELSANTTNDWATIKVNKILKPHKFGEEYGLMELRARSRGYGLYQFENAFCRLV